MSTGRIRRCQLVVFGLLVFAFGAVSASAQLYLSQDSNSNGLYVLDTTTGSGTLLGASGVTSSTVGLAPGSTAGTLFGTIWSSTVVIQTDGSGAAALGSAGAEGLAYDPVGNVMYGAINGDLFTINPATGDQAVSLAAAPGDIEGLAWDATRGVVFGIGDTTSLYSYNPNTNIWSLVGDTGINWDSGGLAYDPGADVLYVIGTGGGNNLYRLNPSTGAATLVGPTGISPTEGGLAFIGTGAAITPVPTASDVGLVALTLLLAIAGLVLIRPRG